MAIQPLFGPYALRRVEAADASEIFESIDTQRTHLGPWLPFVAQTQRVEQTAAVVAQMTSDEDNPVFTLRCGEKFAGLIGFKEADRETHTIEIGYWLREEHQGKGVMTAAVRALCWAAFTEMDMMHVRIRCAPGNLPSNRIPQRLGFRLTGVEPQAEQLEDGTLADLNIYLLDRQTTSE